MNKYTARQLPNNQKGFTPLVIIVAVAAFLAVSYLTYQAFVAQPKGQNTPQQITKPRSKAPGMITQVVTTKAIDSKTGQAVSPTNTFSKTDRVIYLVIALKNPTVGTKIEYTRYLNGKFLDNRSLTVARANTNNIIFDWTLNKPGAAHLAGNYKVKVYTNGIFEKEINYLVQ